jgi:iron complex outermembrane receptor protein
VFGQVVWSVLPRVRFTGGLRYSADQRKIITRNSLPAGCAVPAPGVTVRVVAGSPLTQCPREFRVENDGVSWLASLDYRPTDTIMMYGKIAHGYRAGGINLRGSNTIESFSPFNPESVTEYEAGLKIDAFRNLLRVNLAAYYDDYSNIQRSTTIATPNGNQTFVSNAASGTIKGVEAEVTFRPTPRLTLSGTGGLTDAKYRRFIDANLGDRSHETFGVPRWTASATGRYVLPTQFGRIALQSDYSYRSSFFLAPELPVPSQLFQRAYGLLDANVTVDITSLNLSLSAFGRNLTNVVHYESGLGLGPSSGYNYKITSDPRTYGVSAAYRF